MPLPSSSPCGPRPAGTPTFLVRIDLVTGRMELAGALTARTAHLLLAAVPSLVRAGAGRWTVDVTGLTACDHSGLRAIGATYRRALRHDRRMTLVGAPPALVRALSRLRLDGHVLASDRGSDAARVPLAGGARGPAPGAPRTGTAPCLD
ncbi:STAS domain-containing protein [Geodermatophilus sp. SYSU D00758]